MGKQKPQAITETMNLPVLFFVLATICFSYSEPFCHHSERQLLLQFKDSLAIEKHASSAYRKTDSWGRNGSDCCVWDGVECDENNASVIGLDLSSSYLYGTIPYSIGKLQFLHHLDLSFNNLSGQIPPSLENLTQLLTLELHNNHLSGPISLSFARLVSLQTIMLDGNNLSGDVDFDMFLSLKNLTELELSNNRLSVLMNPSINETLPQLVWLGLESCNLTEFPKFLRHQKRLEELYLALNQIGGNVPKWLWNMSTQTLEYLGIQRNFLTGQLPPVLPFVNLLFLLLNDNSFTGSLPVPHPSTFMYKASTNAFDGEIPTLFCNLYSGKSPQNSTIRNQLEVMDLSGNRLQGKLPHSLVNCTMLLYLNLENNRLDDVFPHWLGTLSELKVLLLGSNRFHGEIIKPEEAERSYIFPHLQIIVLSYNHFSGVLPSQYFHCWKSMQASGTARKAEYSNATISDGSTGNYISYFRISIQIKGVNRHYDMINEELSIVDLSHNKFTGEIPDIIGILKRLISLDLSNNSLIGSIPSSLESLTKLESLDLSANRLAGKIPQELTRLTFLQYFNVSYNRLDGTIPQPGQLSSFASIFYEGNLGLCGIPLHNKCKAPGPQPSAFEEEHEDSSSLFNCGWKVVAMGYGCGFVIGLLIGKHVLARWQRWFPMAFRV